MDLNRIVTFIFGIMFIVILYVIIYYALKIMYKDVKRGNQRRTNVTIRKYGIEIYEPGGNEGLEEGSVMIIRGDITIGRREDNDIILTEPFVSSAHAKIYSKNNDIIIEDLNSTNGVYVNEERILGKVKLIPNDKIRIGSAIFRILKSDSI